MPTLDPARASLVTQAMRFDINEDATLYANNRQARRVDIETQVTAADAPALADAMFAELKKEAMAHRVDAFGVLASQDDLAGTVPHFIVDAAEYATDGRTSKLCGIEFDWLTGLQTLVVRG